MTRRAGLALEQGCDIDARHAGPAPTTLKAGVVELVDTPDLGSGAARCVGSSPILGTRTALPVLQGLLCEVSGSTLRVTGTDLDMTVRTQAEVEVMEEGRWRRRIGRSGGCSCTATPGPLHGAGAAMSSSIGGLGGKMSLISRPTMYLTSYRAT